MEISKETTGSTTPTTEGFSVGRSDIRPTLSGDKLAIAFIKEITTKESSTPTSMFGSTSAAQNKIAVMTYDGDSFEYLPTKLMVGEITDEEAILKIEGITDGMKASQQEKIVSTIMHSKGLVANAEDREESMKYFQHTDANQLKEVYSTMNTQLEEMKKTVTMNGDVAAHYMFRKHVLLQGQKGQGKTYRIDKLLRENSVQTEYLAGHEGIEAIDLQGYLIKDDTGNLIWKDGVVTAAFRKAASGNKCALFIDEMLRIPKRELNFLVGILTPDSVGNFNLRTGRVSHKVEHTGADGKTHLVAEEELISIPQNMLWAVGTTNAGSGYAVDTIDEALADRFRTIIVSMNEEEMKNILLEKLKEKSFDKKIAKKLMEFYSNFNMLRGSGELTKTTSIRHLVEVIDLADSEDMIPIMLNHLIPTLTDQDTNGEPNESQEAIIEELIEKNVG